MKIISAIILPVCTFIHLCISNIRDIALYDLRLNPPAKPLIVGSWMIWVWRRHTIFKIFVKGRSDTNLLKKKKIFKNFSINMKFGRDIYSLFGLKLICWLFSLYYIKKNYFRFDMLDICIKQNCYTLYKFFLYNLWRYISI